LRTSRSIDHTVVLVIDTDPQQSTTAGGAWWDVAVPEISSRASVTAAYETYRAKLADTKKDP
jgi:3D-(3,5/4)-trihydroxycyclohexane-1,2-dione acylhydrolase (decyclizing)